MSTPNDPYSQQPDPNQYPGQQPYGQQPVPGQPYPGQSVPVGPNGEQLSDPDSTMGIVGLVLAIVCCAPLGLIISWIAQNKSKERGYKNTPAKIGVIIGAIFTVISVLSFIFVIATGAFSADVSTTPYLLG